MLLACLACSAALLSLVIWQVRRTNETVRTTPASEAGGSMDDLRGG
jgi:hypothetical protein